MTFGEDDGPGVGALGNADLAELLDDGVELGGVLVVDGIDQGGEAA